MMPICFFLSCMFAAEATDSLLEQLILTGMLHCIFMFNYLTCSLVVVIAKVFRFI